MNASWFPPVLLVALVSLLTWTSSSRTLRPLFHWLPVPLWCYGVPMVPNACNILPAAHPAYRWIMDQWLPVALGLLLMGMDFSWLARIGAQALLAMAAGSLGIILGGPIIFWLVHTHLPTEAWKGIGALAATWTGGSLNMLALRTVLEIPPEVFAPLVVVDALVAYGWMALLIGCQAFSPRINRWLGAADVRTSTVAVDGPGLPWNWRGVSGCLLVAIILAVACWRVATLLPVGGLVASTSGWTILLVSATALLLAAWPAMRRLGRYGSVVGSPSLYLVLAALGAQASLRALVTTPWWIVVGLGCVTIHGLALLVAGRLLRLPFGVLATASQADVGGVVSAPLVGAVYGQDLAPIGLCLALVGNAVGTYAGLAAASVAKSFLSHP